MKKGTKKKQVSNNKESSMKMEKPKTNKKKQSRFFYAYYVIAIIYAAYILLHSASYLFLGDVFNMLLLPLDLLWIVGILILSISALVIFVRQRMPKIALVLPIYHITMVGLIILLSVSLVIIAIKEGVPPPDIPGLIFVDIITSLFEFGFSFYLLKRFQ